MSRRSRIRLAVSGVVDVVWFGNKELYDGRTLSAGEEDVEGTEDVKEWTEAAEEPDEDDIDMAVVLSSKAGGQKLGKKQHRPGEGSHNIASSKLLGSRSRIIWLELGGDVSQVNAVCRRGPKGSRSSGCQNWARNRAALGRRPIT